MSEEKTVKKYLSRLTQAEPRVFQIYIFYFVCALMCAVFRGVGNMDEIWNYTFANNIANGLLPYRDFNMLQTPLSAIIPGLVMKVTGSHLLITRIMGAALHAGIATVMYRISRRLGGGVFLSMIPGCGFILLFIFNVFFEYSGLIVFLELLLIDLDTQVIMRNKGEGKQNQDGCVYDEATRLQNENQGAQNQTVTKYDTVCSFQHREIKTETEFEEKKEKEKKKEYDVLQDLDVRFLILTGLIGGMAILSKQTFGLFIALASWISAALISKKRLRAFFLRGIGSAMFCTLMLIFFLATGTFDDCIDMCLRGISTFAKPWYYWVYMASDVERFWQGIFLPPLFMCGAGFAISTRKKKIGRMMGIALLYILFSFINMYPLANSFHINTCFGPALILLVPIVQAHTNPARGKTPERRKKSRLLRKAVNIAAGLGVLAFAVVCFVVRPVDVLVTNNLRMSFTYKHFEATFLSESTKENMTALHPVIGSQIEAGKEIYILDNTAELYLLPYDIYHKDLDMFLYGNSGSTTPQDILDASYEPGAVYLMAGDDRKNTQFPWTEMRAFKKRLEQQEDVGPFEMYTAPINNTTP